MAVNHKTYQNMQMKENKRSISKLLQSTKISMTVYMNFNHIKCSKRKKSAGVLPYEEYYTT